MPKIQFNRQEVLSSAMSLFWREGYSATSMQALFKVTGLKPGSVYLAFGNKEGLFKASVDFYADQSIDTLKSKLDNVSTVEQNICTLLTSMVEESTKEGYCSCFLLKSQLELDNHPELKQYVSDYLVTVENIYAASLTPIYGNEEAESKAASIMLHIFGLRVYGYHSDRKEQLLRSLQLGLHWLPWVHASH